MTGAFVPVYRGPTPEIFLTQGQTSRAVGFGVDVQPEGTEDFYLAIRKDELGTEWFLSAYMKQFFPGAVSGYAARSLGTRVVTFRQQNGKLFIFDADRRKKTSDTFDPEVLVDAYPIVRDFEPFNAMIGSDDYVLFDPSAGLNQFGVVGDLVGSWAEDRFEVELSFLQRFRELDDGISYEQVFSGYSQLSNPGSWQLGEDNPFRGSGTLGIALRRYKESPGFVEREMPELEHYFTSDLRLVPNTGETEYVAAKWNVHPGMEPIVWKISPLVQQIEGPLAQYDMVGTIKRGIESWNLAFGFTAFTATIAGPEESYADDETNYVVWDGDPSYGAAFANWRTNPNTGEIRGASIYVGAGWLSSADEMFEDDVVTETSSLAPSGEPKESPKYLAWGPMPEATLCSMLAPSHRVMGDRARPLSQRGAADAPVAVRTKKEKVELYIQGLILHEIGHTLGLRHNFKGSLLPPSSSTMDYVDNVDSLELGVPGSYDVAAIRWLYGLTEELPQDPFCTDDSVGVDPTCEQYDRTANPLEDYHTPWYREVLDEYLTSASDIPPSSSLNAVLGFVRAGENEHIRLRAFHLAHDAVAVPMDPARLAADANLGSRADFVGRRIFSRLFIEDASARGDFTNDPPADPLLMTEMMTQLRGYLLNSDRIRSFATRRMVVDLLKKRQTIEAYQMLREARALIAVEQVQATGTVALEVEDLLHRIDRAMQPYFD